MNEVTEKFRETGAQAEGNLRCEDADHDIAGKHAVFSVFLDLQLGQETTLTAQGLGHWEEHIQAGLLNCHDVDVLCNFPQVRGLCPTQCGCGLVRNGVYDFSGCPAACDDNRAQLVASVADE
eukprot:2879627-Amphidinium_carterae.1